MRKDTARQSPDKGEAEQEENDNDTQEEQDEDAEEEARSLCTLSSCEGLPFAR